MLFLNFDVSVRHFQPEMRKETHKSSEGGLCVSTSVGQLGGPALTEHDALCPQLHGDFSIDITQFDFIGWRRLIPPSFKGQKHFCKTESPRYLAQLWRSRCPLRRQF